MRDGTYRYIVAFYDGGAVSDERRWILGYIGPALEKVREQGQHIKEQPIIIRSKRLN